MWVPDCFFGHKLSGMNGFVGGISQGAADTQAVVVSEIASDFPDDHGNGIGGKFYLHSRIEIVDGFDQPDAANLKQIIHIFVGDGKTADHT